MLMKHGFEEESHRAFLEKEGKKMIFRQDDANRCSLHPASIMDNSRALTQTKEVFHASELMERHPPKALTPKQAHCCGDLQKLRPSPCLHPTLVRCWQLNAKRSSIFQSVFWLAHKSQRFFFSLETFLSSYPPEAHSLPSQAPGPWGVCFGGPLLAGVFGAPTLHNENKDGPGAARAGGRSESGERRGIGEWGRAVPGWFGDVWGGFKSGGWLDFFFPGERVPKQHLFVEHRKLQL